MYIAHNNLVANVCHVYMICDGCPTDWLVDELEDQWHTIAYFVFQTDPRLEQQRSRINQIHSFLDQDPYFHKMLLPFKSFDGKSFVLKKWKAGAGNDYREKFLDRLSQLDPGFYPQFNAVSFQEKQLRTHRTQLLHRVNQFREAFGAHTVGFTTGIDKKGRPTMTHGYMRSSVGPHAVSMPPGFHSLSMPDNKMLVLLLMAWVISDQTAFYTRKILMESPHLGFDKMLVTVVSDKLSGDDDIKKLGEEGLGYLMDSPMQNVTLTRSDVSDKYPVDLLVDNLAGLLNECISNPDGDFNRKLMTLPFLDFLDGWNQLSYTSNGIELLPIIKKCNKEIA